MVPGVLVALIPEAATDTSADFDSVNLASCAVMVLVSPTGFDNSLDVTEALLVNVSPVAQ